MKLTVLGCGDAFASEGRFNTSFLLTDSTGHVLVDCGASTLIRLKQLGISPMEIDTIVITHFHGDHFGGLPFFMLSCHVEYERTTPITIIGPEGLKEKVYALQEALYPGTTSVLDTLIVEFREYEDQKTLQHGDLKVYARQVSHAPPSNPHGVRLTRAGKAFAFSGDTEWNDSLIDLAKDSDVFVIECNNYDKESPGHLSYNTIRDRRADFGSARLLLTHMGSVVIAQQSMEIERLQDGMEIDF